MRLNRSDLISILVTAFLQVQETRVLFIIRRHRSLVVVVVVVFPLFIGNSSRHGEKHGITAGDVQVLLARVSTLPWVLQSLILARRMSRAHVNHFLDEYYCPRHGGG